MNRRSEELSQKVIQKLPDLASLHLRLNWVSPLEKDRFVEYQDTAFLKACGFEYLSAELRAFPGIKPPGDRWDRSWDEKRSDSCRHCLKLHFLAPRLNTLKGNPVQQGRRIAGTDDTVFLLLRRESRGKRTEKSEKKFFSFDLQHFFGTISSATLTFCLHFCTIRSHDICKRKNHSAF